MGCRDVQAYQAKKVLQVHADPLAHEDHQGHQAFPVCQVLRDMRAYELLAYLARKDPEAPLALLDHLDQKVLLVQWVFQVSQVYQDHQECQVALDHRDQLAHQVIAACQQLLLSITVVTVLLEMAMQRPKHMQAPTAAGMELMVAEELWQRKQRLSLAI